MSGGKVGQGPGRLSPSLAVVSDAFDRDRVAGIKGDVVLDAGYVLFGVLIAPGRILQRFAFGDDGEIARRALVRAAGGLVAVVEKGHRDVCAWEIDHVGQIALTEDKRVAAFHQHRAAGAHRPCAFGLVDVDLGHAVPSRCRVVRAYAPVISQNHVKAAPWPRQASAVRPAPGVARSGRERLRDRHRATCVHCDQAVRCQ